MIYEKENVGIYDQSNDERINYNSKENDFSNNANVIQRHSDIERKTITTVEVHQSSPPAPPCPPPMSYKWQSGKLIKVDTLFKYIIVIMNEKTKVLIFFFFLSKFIRSKTNDHHGQTNGKYNVNG